MDSSTPLYNWTPILTLLLIGLFVASVPLIYIWYKNKHLSNTQKLYYLTVLITFLTFDLILFGAFTRLTDSGLGCPDWPGCYGSASPFGASHSISAEELLDPYGPVSWFKAWVEMLHRYFASAIGFLIIILTIGCWYYRKQIKLSPWLPSFTLVWILLQGAFGAWTVTMKLFPAIVTAHLLAGMFLLVLVRIQSVQLQDKIYHNQVLLKAKQKYLILAVLILLCLQLALGGWVSTNYAVLACGAEFPTCSNSIANPWWPEMDFKQGFTLWRELHLSASGEELSLAALTAIHYTHRIVAYLVTFFSLLLAWRLYNYVKLRHYCKWLTIIILIQVFSGISTVMFNRPLFFAVLHTAGATALILILVSLYSSTKISNSND